MEEITLSKKLLIILIAVVSVILLISIGLAIWANPIQVVQRNKEIKGLEATIASLNDEIINLNAAVKDTTVTEVLPQSSLQVVDGKIVPEFFLINDKLVLPNKFELPMSYDDVSNSNVMVGSRFKFVPSDNWITKMSGSALHLSHPSKIWGTIKGVSIKERLAVGQYQPMLQQFFTGFPATTITYRNIFIEDSQAGMVATAPIKVKETIKKEVYPEEEQEVEETSKEVETTVEKDAKVETDVANTEPVKAEDVKKVEPVIVEETIEKDMVLVVGFAQRGETATTFLFAYEDDKSTVQKELIDLLIRSGSFGDSRLKLD